MYGQRSQQQQPLRARTLLTQQAARPPQGAAVSDGRWHITCGTRTAVESMGRLTSSSDDEAQSGAAQPLCRLQRHAQPALVTQRRAQKIPTVDQSLAAPKSLAARLAENKMAVKRLPAKPPNNQSQQQQGNAFKWRNNKFSNVKPKVDTHLCSRMSQSSPIQPSTPTKPRKTPTSTARQQATARAKQAPAAKPVQPPCRRTIRNPTLEKRSGHEPQLQPAREQRNRATGGKQFVARQPPILPEQTIPLAYNPECLPPAKRQLLRGMLMRGEQRDRSIMDLLRSEPGDPSKDKLRMTMQALPMALSPTKSPYTEDGHRHLRRQHSLPKKLGSDDERRKKVNVLHAPDGRAVLSKTLGAEDEKRHGEPLMIQHEAKQLTQRKREELQRKPDNSTPSQNERELKAMQERAELDLAKQQLQHSREKCKRKQMQRSKEIQLQRLQEQPDEPEEFRQIEEDLQRQCALDALKRHQEYREQHEREEHEQREHKERQERTEREQREKIAYAERERKREQREREREQREREREQREREREQREREQREREQCEREREQCEREREQCEREREQRAHEQREREERARERHEREQRRQREQRERDQRERIQREQEELAHLQQWPEDCTREKHELYAPQQQLVEQQLEKESLEQKCLHEKQEHYDQERRYEADLDQKRPELKHYNKEENMPCFGDYSDYDTESSNYEIDMSSSLENDEQEHEHMVTSHSEASKHAVPAVEDRPAAGTSSPATTDEPVEPVEPVEQVEDRQEAKVEHAQCDFKPLLECRQLFNEQCERSDFYNKTYCSEPWLAMALAANDLADRMVSNVQEEFNHSVDNYVRDFLDAEIRL